MVRASKPTTIQVPTPRRFAKGQHKVVAAGDKIPIKDLDVTVVAAAGKAIAGQGEPNPNCAGIRRAAI